ncbi:MBL fold metallo-hydrolase RNA specificity domain-containing protein [Pelotomaculum propionicicum]|uniref:Ribonuclease n=1 Tax=Pelotomaculum propionicicum TaxID=258475 RepID=A0A4Y7RN64_9FIRM|nr:MBL fold metallo-hydrolase [Pelotomaculum propionicicum]TEB10303.1 Ribonuclease [Pelotomaculum propionicicum]
MRLQFLGAAGTVTGSCFLLDTESTRIMIECGMFQGKKEVRERNYESFKVPPRSVNHVLLTHAHIDHSGMIPKLIKNGFKGKVYATAPTVELCEVLLPDSAYIQEMEVERKNRKFRRAGKSMIEPIYTVNEAYKSLPFFKAVQYDEIIQVTPDIKARFVDAGHILGSAMIEVWVNENGRESKLVFSGDIGNKDRPIIKDPSSVAEADYLIMESTYGARLHENHEQEIEALHKVIWETYEKGGNLIIPAFAVERTQDLLFHLFQLAESKRMPAMTVYIDSPLATAATDVFRKHHEVFDQVASEIIKRGQDPLQQAGIKFTKSAEESKALNQIDRAIIISASGMCEAGRIRHHLKYNLWRPDSTVLFVGFQADGSLGRQILDGQKTVKIFGDEIAVKADIRYIESYSAHADQAGLIEWVKNFTRPPREVFIVHGEPESASTLAALLKSELGLKTTIPEWQQIVEILPEGTVKPEEEVRAAYESLAAKLQKLVAVGMEPARREEILARIAELENIIDQDVNKAAV